jgi:thiosulfate/3-mercaptopyruvate sulfurtransferase
MPPKPHRTLIDTATLAAALDDPDWVVLDCRSTLGDRDAGQQRFLAGHLPGAQHAHLEDHLSDPPTASTGRHPLPDADRLARQFGAWGIDESVQVVAYDDAGGAYAARLWWLLRWLGHDAVAVLDGGWQAWVAEGRAVTTAARAPQARHFDAWLDDTRWLETHEVQALLGTSNAVLFDARGAPRFRGDEEPIDPVAGHIPGAINLPFTDNLGADGRFKPVAELRARFAVALGTHAAEAAVCYCGSGVTACHNLLALEHAGLSGARLYAGSWSEWIRDPSRLVARG